VCVCVCVTPPAAQKTKKHFSKIYYEIIHKNAGRRGGHCQPLKRRPGERWEKRKGTPKKKSCAHVIHRIIFY